MSKKKPKPPADPSPEWLTQADTAAILASAPAGIAPRTADNPAGLLIDAYPLGAVPIVRMTPDELCELYPSGDELTPTVGPVPSPDALRAIPAPAIAPVGKRGDKGFVWELDALWTERVERMAAIAGLNAQSYLDSLLRRAWVGMDQRHRGRI